MRFRPARNAGMIGFSVLLPSTAMAHTGLGEAAGFFHGLMHPLGGADHVLAIVAVGLYAAQLGGRALWALPLAFISAMTLAALVGIAKTTVPLVESGIAVSVLACGLAVALRISLPALAAGALAAFFAIFHGYAHGTEVPIGSPAFVYIVGFTTATAGLIALGAVLARLVAKLRYGRIGVVEAAGGVTALAGVAMVVGAIG